MRSTRYIASCGGKMMILGRSNAGGRAAGHQLAVRRASRASPGRLLILNRGLKMSQEAEKMLAVEYGCTGHLSRSQERRI